MFIALATGGLIALKILRGQYGWSSFTRNWLKYSPKSEQISPLKIKVHMSKINTNIKTPNLYFFNLWEMKIFVIVPRNCLKTLS